MTLDPLKVSRGITDLPTPATNPDAATKEYVDTAVGGVISSWGEASTAQFAGAGSPVGVVTPNGEGDLYVDVTTPGLWQATGTADTDWQEVTGGSSGIAFDTANSGGYLDVETTSTDGDGYGIHVHDTSSGDVLLESNGALTVQTDDGEAGVAVSGDASLFAHNSSAGANTPAFYVSGVGGTNELAARLDVGGVFRVVDSAGNAIFEVRDDGTVHILTGNTVVADL